jgi:ferredoxin/flavodoxin---NADP+ reductase
VRCNIVAINGWAGGVGASAVGGAVSSGVVSSGVPSWGGRKLTLRFWLRPVEILGSERVSGLTVERTHIDAGGAFGGTGEFETLDVQMVLRSVGYQSVPLDGVPFDSRACVVPNASGRVLGADGAPLPGEYVAGWLKRGPTGVIGTNKSDAAETVRCLLADLVPGSGAGEVPRAGLLRYRDADAEVGDGDGDGESRVAALLASRGVRPVSYAEWLRIETAEAELAKSLGRGERVKLPSREAIWSACRPSLPS